MSTCKAHNIVHANGAACPACEAAAELTRLRADLAAVERERDALREALESIDAVAVDFGYFETAARTMQEIARAALEKPHG